MSAQNAVNSALQGNAGYTGIHQYNYNNNLFTEGEPGTYNPLNEQLLAYIWKLRLYNKPADIATTDGRRIKVIHPGIQNKDAGPDFLNAKLEIEGVTWAGNVEIHTRASHWNMHRHQHDDAYNNVILHVVYVCDTDISLPDGTILPVLQLQDYLTDSLLANLTDMYRNNYDIPCAERLYKANSLVIKNTLERMVISRLQDKGAMVYDMLKVCRGDWEEVSYRLLAKAFGFKINSVPFELLAGSVTYRQINKEKYNSHTVEALLFGAAGFLGGEPEDDYHAALQNEFNYLQQKYNITPLDKSIWKFLRMRPVNFPPVRIAQFAALLLKYNNIFSRLTGSAGFGEWKEMFMQLPVNAYWNTHYMFGKTTANHSVQLGERSINGLLINTIAVLLFSYGRYTNDAVYTERAEALLEDVSAEENHIINKYKSCGLKPENAWESQAMLQLYNTLCSRKQCVRCGILADVLKA